MSPDESAASLRRAVGDAHRMLADADDALTTVRPGPGKWCAREVLGHLIDSACNNHRRFVLGQAETPGRWEGYTQDLWVSSQRYAEEPWTDLVALWTAYNRHLAHVMASTPASAAAREAASPDGSRQLSVSFLMEDYVTHLNHHVGQIRSLLNR